MVEFFRNVMLISGYFGSNHWYGIIAKTKEKTKFNYIKNMISTVEMGMTVL